MPLGFQMISKDIRNLTLLLTLVLLGVTALEAMVFV